MSLIKANAVQIGQSPTATQNFTLAVPSSPNGTIKLARGNAGATTQDVISVDASGNVSFAGITGLGNISNSTAIATGSTIARSLANRFADVVNVKDFGAVGNGIADDTAAFSSAGSISSNVEVEIPKGTYLLNSNPSPTGSVTWIVQKGVSFTGVGTIWSASNKIVSRGNFRSIESNPSFYNGIFGYLEQNAAQKHYGTIGCHGSVRTFGGGGSAGEADIAISGFAANDLVGGVGGAWALYGTAIRQSGVNGATHGLEIDIANMGNTVPLFPAQMLQSGQTHALWIASGGEATNISNVGTASVAIGIIRNDSNASPSASFDKGIVFHNKSILGTDGATGSGIAIAFATRHQLIWFNNSNQACSEIVTNATDVTKSYRLDFSDFGLLVNNRTNGRTVFQIESILDSVNGIQIKPSISGVSPSILPRGDDANLNLRLTPKGSGRLSFGTNVSTSDVPITSYIEILDAAGNIRKLAVIS